MGERERDGKRALSFSADPPPLGLIGGGTLGSGLDSHRHTTLGPRLGSIGREGQESWGRGGRNSVFHVQADLLHL